MEVQEEGVRSQIGQEEDNISLTNSFSTRIVSSCTFIGYGKIQLYP